jgi:cell wall-associated NlpC family hydrolase
VAIKYFYAYFIIIILLLFSGCSTRGISPAPKTPVAKAPITKTPTSKETSSSLKAKLYAQYREWKGVRYRIGGLSKSGIDCSGFAYLTFRSKLGITLPRSTRQQARLGSFVKKKNLQTGDLLFFKTGVTTRHVGIYLEKHRFLHASTSKGVIISNLDDDYWKSHYWQAKRIRQKK